MPDRGCPRPAPTAAPGAASAATCKNAGARSGNAYGGLATVLVRSAKTGGRPFIIGLATSGTTGEVRLPDFEGVPLGTVFTRGLVATAAASTCGAKTETLVGPEGEGVA